VNRTCNSTRERFIRQQLDRTEPSDFTLLIEARDFLRVNLPKLTSKQRRALLAWACGETFAQIARREQVTGEAIHDRVASGLCRLRELAEEG